ncbi:hypothetical protein R3P38DRAFT_3233252 [Favolaschia claudopus]|uniref:Uncharacterized protein n=1 Tax=Favolaschia claudopus TaxID=2862362 RepID=A0AAV9ZIN8_9AGAR
MIATLSCQRVVAAEHLARPPSLLYAFFSRLGSRLAVFTFQHPSASLFVFQGLIFIKFLLRLQILEFLVSRSRHTTLSYTLSSVPPRLTTFPSTKILMISVLIGWPILTDSHFFRVFLADDLCRSSASLSL